MQLPKDTPQHILDQVPPHLHPPSRIAQPKRFKPRVLRQVAIEFTIDAATRSEANLGGRIKDKIHRKTELKEATRTVLSALKPPTSVPWIAWVVAITITRLGGKYLDGDNLQRAMKPVRDEVARWLGRDDAELTIDWKYEQLPGWAEGVRVRVVIPEGPP